MSNGSERIDVSPWCTVVEAAAYCKLSTKTIWRACRAGQLRHARVGGRREVRTQRAWCDDWLLASASPVEVKR